MTQLTSDFKGVAVYLDDILVRGKNAEDHLENLRQLLQDHGLRCRLDKCEFAKPTVEYLVHTVLFHPRAYPRERKLMQFVKCHDLTIFQRLNHF